MAGNLITCVPKRLPQDKIIAAAQRASAENPLNHPQLYRLSRAVPGFKATKEYIAVITSKYWRSGGVKLTVGFLEQTTQSLQKRILNHMNAWSTYSNVSFQLSNDSPQVRISREADGYWSYLGTDILSIEPDQPTMNLEGFTDNTEDAEFYRVVRHETGHTLGCPHEHMRRDLVRKIDPEKAIQYYGQLCGWSPEEVTQQVLTPIEESSVLGTPLADGNSIMCYQVPSSITVDHVAIPGGLDIDKQDYDFMALIYPKPATS